MHTFSIGIVGMKAQGLDPLALTKTRILGGSHVCMGVDWFSVAVWWFPRCSAHLAVHPSPRQHQTAANAERVGVLDWLDLVVSFV